MLSVLELSSLPVVFRCKYSENMSLVSWLSKKNPRLVNRFEKPGLPGLPDPNSSESSQSAKVCEAANEAIVGAVKEKTARKRRGPYHKYTDEERAEIAKYGCLHGCTKAAAHFSKKLDRNVSYTTVQSMMIEYKSRLSRVSDPSSVSSLAPKPRGRTTLLPTELDNMVCQHLRAIRASGGVVSRRITIATANGIVKARNPSLLKEFGGFLDFSIGWVNSVHSRINFVKRKGTKTARKLPENFGSLKEKFLAGISDKVKEHQIPADLIMNFDETGLALVPAADWTLAEKGSRDVAMLGKDDKRQITAVLACTPTGKLLPPQLLYQGSTSRCHPPASIPFPEAWDIWHSDSHWSTHETILRYINTVLKPYADSVKQKLGLADSQRGLIVLDIYAAHRTPDVLAEFDKAGFELVFVPANCTGELQPLDLSVNGPLKEKSKEAFSRWYSEHVCDSIKELSETGESVEESISKVPQPDLRMSIVKPLHCKWLIDAFAAVASRPDLVRHGWETSGILQALAALLQSDVPNPVSVNEHYLESVNCQSRLDGRTWSHACTVISGLCCKAGLSSGIALDAEAFPSAELQSKFVELMREGNALYDKVFSSQGNPYLSAYDVVKKVASLQLNIPPYGELGFNTTEVAEKKIAAYLERAGFPAYSIFTSKGKSFAVMFAANGNTFILDSHAHGRRGGLLALCCNLESCVHFICNGLLNGLSFERGASLTFVSLRDAE